MAEYSVSHLNDLHDQGVLSHLDYYFAKIVADIFDDASPLAMLSAGLASKALADGHVCFNLGVNADTEVLDDPGGRSVLRLPGLDAWVKTLENTEMVGKTSDRPAAEDFERREWIKKFPLILDRDNNLYLSKYYDFQYRLASDIASRVLAPADPVDGAFIREGMARFFKNQDPVKAAGQQSAVRNAMTRNFLVISGGPGTGKTHITNIISKLLEMWATSNNMPGPRILSMAPTGKAASRLENGATIHSVLQPKPGGIGFRHNRDNPLAADMVIIDEASMIDIALMTRLMEAIPPKARVILLGDRNQLSPVQAGAVFTDICNAKAMAGHRVFLDFNFRSQGQSGIENLANAVNNNDADAVSDILTGGMYEDVRFEETGNTSGPGFTSALTAHVAGGYRALAESLTPEQAMADMDAFRILCAHNRGEAGTLQINHLCEMILRRYGDSAIKRSFFRQIVMVRRNDYRQELFNGDTGVVWEEKGNRTVWFPDTGGNARRFRYLDIPAHEPGFAVTIHKSQGSEYGTVLIVIPDRISPVVTRQLLYTGITRARKKVVVLGSLDVIREAMETPLERRSNLAAALTRRLGQEGGNTQAPG